MRTLYSAHGTGYCIMCTTVLHDPTVLCTIYIANGTGYYIMCAMIVHDPIVLCTLYSANDTNQKKHVYINST